VDENTGGGEMPVDELLDQIARRQRDQALSLQRGCSPNRDDYAPVCFRCSSTVTDWTGFFSDHKGTGGKKRGR
jgi:hypothetical protein